MAVRPIPKGYHTVTPYLVAKDAAKLLKFMEKGLGAKVRAKFPGPKGRVAHAEVQVGDSMIMVGGARPGDGAVPAMLYLYVKDVDALWRRAVKAGGKSLMKPSNQFYGDRNAGVKVAEGFQFWMATHVENVPPKEMERRSKAHSHG